MARKTIRAAQFMYYVPTGRTRVRRDGVQEDVLAVRHALRGDTVDIPRAEDAERGTRAGAFVPEEVEQESPVVEEEVDAGLDFTSHDGLVAWFREARPSIHEVVDAAEGDQEKAQLLLAAEETATGGQPRKGVVSGLNRIINAAETDEEDA